MKPLLDFENYPYKNSSSTKKLVDTAYKTGIVGAVTILLCGYYFARIDLVKNNKLIQVELFGTSINASLVALFVLAVVMMGVEFFRRWQLEGKDFFVLSPHLVEKKYLSFAFECLRIYFGGLIIAAIIWLFYTTCSEYGFYKKAKYYLVFFQFLSLGISFYIKFGFFYIALTRAVQHSPTHDQFSLVTASYRRVTSVFAKLPIFSTLPSKFEPANKIALLGLVVKIFFLPLMTVFFLDQFTHLSSNWSYLLSNFSPSKLSTSALFKDFFNISYSVIFAIDVGIAWVGYAVSTRWLKNSNFSADPTIGGWVVAAFCYPPLNHSITGIYLPLPAERYFLSWDFTWIVAVLGVLSVLSYFIYMSATVVFGIRFSNLTHRGIISKGPFRFVRHPAYASKNFSWWCLLFPVIVHGLFTGDHIKAIPQAFGLVGITTWYYFRAITEERHLSWDPDYIAYCEKVKYRFIPGII